MRGSFQALSETLAEGRQVTPKLSPCSPRSPAPSPTRCLRAQDMGPGEMGCARGRGADHLMRPKARVKPSDGPAFKAHTPPLRPQGWGFTIPSAPPLSTHGTGDAIPPLRMVGLGSFLPLPSSLLMLLPSKHKGAFPTKKAPRNLPLTQPLCSRHAAVMDTTLGSQTRRASLHERQRPAQSSPWRWAPGEMGRKATWGQQDSRLPREVGRCARGLETRGRRDVLHEARTATTKPHAAHSQGSIGTSGPGRGRERKQRKTKPTSLLK